MWCIFGINTGLHKQDTSQTEHAEYLPQKFPSQTPHTIRENCQSNQAVWLNNATSEDSLPSDRLVLCALKQPSKKLSIAKPNFKSIHRIPFIMRFEQIFMSAFSFLRICKKMDSLKTQSFKQLPLCIQYFCQGWKEN